MRFRRICFQRLVCGSTILLSALVTGCAPHSTLVLPFAAARASLPPTPNFGGVGPYRGRARGRRRSQRRRQAFSRGGSTTRRSGRAGAASTGRRPRSWQSWSGRRGSARTSADSAGRRSGSARITSLRPPRPPKSSIENRRSKMSPIADHALCCSSARSSAFLRLCPPLPKRRVCRRTAPTLPD